MRLLAFLCVLAINPVLAAVCPDPNTSSLQWGEVPAPWVVNPYSPHDPQGEANTQFVKAVILVAGLGKGITCTYKNSVGLYSIMWITTVKIPAPTDYSWINTLGGYTCTDALQDCQFYPLSQ